VRAVADIEVAKSASTAAHSVEKCIVCIVVFMLDNRLNSCIFFARSRSRASWLIEFDRGGHHVSIAAKKVDCRSDPC
jgi:hypothetical protein